MPVVASPAIRDDVALRRIAAADWNALAGGQPFVSHAFLSALETTGCAVPRTGWSPRFLTAWQGDTLVGALPLYAKAHSYGEYVFDWGWAEAYRRHGRRYYPKLLAAVPFTPVPGPRILAADARTRRALLEHALDLVNREGYSSLHVLFPTAEDCALGESAGMIPRRGLQFHWSNPGYRDFADFLSAFSHDKRKKVKQERRKLAEAGVRFERRPGRDVTAADWAFFFQCYETTYRAHHSTPYLTPAFFEELGRTLTDHLLLVVGSRDGRRVCAALDIFDRDTLWGRYWGTTQYVPGLHFEACYYQAIEFCIEQRIGRFEGGAQGSHKLARGLRPVPTYSLHAVGDRDFAAAIADFCTRERVDVAHAQDELESSTPFRSEEAADR
ncbi:MAG: N-acetyltransferase [Burkholderiales bacterium]|nr:N-acetyltransferase [Burkholderiales bacterium]